MVLLVMLGLTVMLVVTAFTVLIAIAAATEVFPLRHSHEPHEDGGTSLPQPAPASGPMTTVS
jgi:hypothetical protein